jgi:hypothetical protein
VHLYRRATNDGREDPEVMMEASRCQTNRAAV